MCTLYNYKHVIFQTKTALETSCYKNLVHDYNEREKKSPGTLLRDKL
uniref:Uncharacterized protein n=1 Tax=Anguilla anguilla TaxID=7936 RepID=A0A0E9W3A3_ANGAN